MHDQLQLLSAILAQWQRLVESNKALNLLYWAMCAVSYRCITMAIKTATFFGVFFGCCLFASCLGGRWGNTERVVTRCRHPVASGVALDMPHWAMSVLLQRTAVAIETAGGRGAFVHHCCLVCIIIHSYKTMLWSIKAKEESTICLLLCLELVCILWAAANNN
jgi:hypothetical protein